MHFYVFEFLFSAVFLYTCYNSIKKYLDSKVAVAIQESEIDDVEYPSVRNSLNRNIYMTPDKEYFLKFYIF